jgi:tRNA(Ile)-lysidine synthase
VSSALLATLDPYLDAPRPWVGFSGGLDSTVLLHLARRRGLEPRAVHIHHGLHPDADTWQSHCERLCAAWELTLEVCRVTVVDTGHGPEAAARDARMQVFRALLGPRETLLLAQHQDDQVETLLLRALRGAGLEGLGAMAPSRPLGAGRLCRPLLDQPRQALRDYARAEGLQWIEDDSNAELRFDRNYLRHEILPRIEARWPGYRSTLSRSAAQLRAVAAALPVAELKRRHSPVGDPGFALSTLPADPEAAKRALRGWLRELAMPPPPARRLEAFLRQLRTGKGAQLRCGPCVLQRYRDAVYCYLVLPPVTALERPVTPGLPLQIPGIGSVLLEGAPRASGPWTLRPRLGGERLLQPGGEHLNLKTLFQGLGVPPWWRDRVPLLYRGDALQLVGPYRRSADPVAAALRLRWQPPLPTP